MTRQNEARQLGFGAGSRHQKLGLRDEGLEHGEKEFKGRKAPTNENKSEPVVVAFGVESWKRDKL